MSTGLTYLNILAMQLPIDEGNKNKPYMDTKGKVTIGIGRNLTDVGISEDEKQLMFRNDVRRADIAARSLFTNFQKLSEARKAVLVNMAFNMGFDTLALFHGLIYAVLKEDWKGAAQHMKNSLWYKQVGARADRLIDQMVKG